MDTIPEYFRKTKKKAHIIVRGDVQGVGYRAFVHRNARTYGLTGYVRNLPNGDVEVLVEGEERYINLMIDVMRKGPARGIVQDLIISWHEYTGNYRSFEVAF